MNDASNDIFLFFAVMLAIPYVVGFPLAAIWVLTAQTVRALTGWKGLLPENVWQDGEAT